jgi:hypothetical protein
LLVLTASVAALLYVLTHASAALLGGDWSFVHDSYGYGTPCRLRPVMACPPVASTSLIRTTLVYGVSRPYP